MYENTSNKKNLLWKGKPHVFQVLEDKPPTTITYIYNSALGKYVWRYNKPKDKKEYRCESRNIVVDGKGYKWVENKTYKISWSFNVPEATSEYGDFVIFQWKSYPNGKQNYPFLITINKNKIILTYVSTGDDNGKKWHRIWTHDIKDNEWNNAALTLHLSDDETVGWITWEYNGEMQKLDGKDKYPARTLDGSNEPKWGVYNRDKPEHAMEQLVGNLKVEILE
ncbi:Uncharacterised protein [Serratia quinivorans]|uniref:polysaccharide lyase n=1 Tax=Serratia quinivorans TaxID=137545 RepID=UPI00217AB55D|nr:polysaccharide lyase [Serratia quinivorans]CAI1965423.1 Uncharacterised protein [Serratia quinivorans]